MLSLFIAFSSLRSTVRDQNLSYTFDALSESLTLIGNMPQGFGNVIGYNADGHLVLSGWLNDNKIMVSSLNGDAKLYLFDEKISTIEQEINFGVFATVMGITQDEEGRTMIGLGDHEGNGITFLQIGWDNNGVEKQQPHPTPLAYIHDFHYNGNGIVYASYQHEFGSTGISFFLMQQTTGGAVTSDWDIENGYQLNQMILKTFTLRNSNKGNLFIGIDNVDRIWFSRGGKWKMHGEANIGAVHKIRFDEAGYLYLMTENGLFKTNVTLQ